MYGLLRQALDVSTVRGNVISNNLVNINTKNFKRSDVKFEDYLNSNVPRVKFRATNDKHIKMSSEFYDVVEDNGTSIRNDGNNVDIDIEKANQAANTLMYNTLVSAISKRFQTMSYVISGR